MILAEYFAHAHRAPGQCAKPSPGKVSRSLHAAYSRAGPRDALPACNRFGLSDGSPPECAMIAQIAHRRYARLIRIRVRTGSRFALRFATTYARTWCEPSQRLPRWLPRKVTNASSCQALVSTVVSRVLQWFPLATRSVDEQSQGGGATSLQALHKSRRARRINMRK